MRARALILRTAGTNCDAETAFAFEQAGATAELLHINRLIREPRRLDDYGIMAIPGGFSYGDDIAAGRIYANQIAAHLREAFAAFVASNRPIIGICNGFQVLVKTDLLPGEIDGRTGQLCTLSHNDCGRFIDRWLHLAPQSRKCIWTQGLGQIQLPIAHGEGKFVCADESIRRALWDRDQVVLSYARADGLPAEGNFPDNPNGSVDDIAGICDSTGLVFGLMPHPERYVQAEQHPAWTRQRPLPPVGDGLQIFRNAVEYVDSTVVS